MADGQLQQGSILFEIDFDVFGHLLFDGAADRFLSDIIHQPGAVQSQLWRVFGRLNDAGDTKGRFDLRAQPGQPGLQVAGVHGGEQSTEGAKLLQGLVQIADQFCGVVGFRLVALLQAFGQGFGMESQASQMTGQLVVQIAPNRCCSKALISVTTRSTSLRF